MLLGAKQWNLKNLKIPFSEMLLSKITIKEVLLSKITIKEVLLSKNNL